MIVQIHSTADRRAPKMLDLAHRLFSEETLEPDALLADEIEGRRPGDVRYFVWDEGGVRAFCRAAFLSAGMLIVHLGVDPQWQGRGLGSRLLDHAQGLNAPAPTFAEVEKGHAMEWWTGRGARILNPNYIQPALRFETEPVPLVLMAIGEVANPVEAIRSVYGEFYGLGEENPLVRRVLAGVVS